MKKTALFVLAGFWLLAAAMAAGQPGNPDGGIHPVIRPELEAQQGKVIFHFTLDPDYHITDVRHGFFKVTLEENEYFALSRVQFPPGEKYEGETVYRNRFQVGVYLNQRQKLEGAMELVFTVGYQICQEKPLEMCLAPRSSRIVVKVPADLAGEGIKGLEENGNGGLGGRISRAFQKQLRDGSLWVYLLAFLAGFLASLTPCVYPVIPIVMGYVGSRSRDSKIRGFYLSVVFSLGLSLVYAILGVVAASTGSIIGAGFQNPVIVVLIALVFILMGLSLAGLFEIPVPAGISARLQSVGKGGFFGALILGGISAVIAAPCVGPVLIAILTMVSQTGNLVSGFLLTFVFSLGLSVLFVVIGTFSGVISSLPRGGRWMTLIKYLFSILLIAGGIVIVSKVAPDWITLMLWAVFLMGLAVLGGLFSFDPKEEIRQRLGRLLLALLFLTGAILFVRAVNRGFFSEPGPVLHSQAESEAVLTWENDLDRALQQAREQDTWVMVDTYTDWCTVCKKLEQKTFRDPQVAQRLEKLKLVKIDFTTETPQNRRIREQYQIIGFPTVLFMDPEGNVRERFSTFLDKQSFLRLLDTLSPRPGQDSFPEAEPVEK